MARACYVISYDIADDRRRLRVSHLLEGHGHRVQYSVFEVWVDEGQLGQLLKRLEHEMGPAGSARIYPLCAACRERRQVLGAGEPTTDLDLLII